MSFTMNKKEIEAMKGAVGQRLEEQGEFRRLDDEMASLNSKINKLENKAKFVMKKSGVRMDDFLDTSGIAFSASMTAHTHAKAYEPLIFDDVLLNLGDGFDNKTGQFKAPTDGRYLFSLTIRAEYHKTVSAEIMAGQEVLARLTSGYGGIERASAAMTVVKELQTDEIVFVRQANDKSGEYHGHGYTAFCGALLD